MNTQDLLYLVLSLCTLWFTIFLCWLLYQAARVLRNANRIIENVTEKLELIVEAVKFIREKVEGLTSTMSLLNGMLGGLVEKFVVRKFSSNLEEKITKKSKKK